MAQTCKLINLMGGRSASGNWRQSAVAGRLLQHVEGALGGGDRLAHQCRGMMPVSNITV